MLSCSDQLLVKERGQIGGNGQDFKGDGYWNSVFKPAMRMYICLRRDQGGSGLHHFWETEMADTFSKPSNRQQKLKWARIWFRANRH